MAEYPAAHGHAGRSDNAVSDGVQRKLWMSPADARIAATAHHPAAVRKRRPMIATVAAERSMAVKMKPCSSANAPSIQVSVL
jgi:hypothetical protein